MTTSMLSNDETNHMSDFEVLKSEVEQERKNRQLLENELRAERGTIDQLLNQMDNLELESRASVEEISIREKSLQSELLRAQKALDDERTIRLQHVYELSRAQDDAEVSRREVRKLNGSILDLQADLGSQSKHVEFLEGTIRASNRVTEQHESDLLSTTAANLSHKEDTHLLRLRLVEAEEGITRWRLKYEDSVAAAAQERTDMGKIYHKQRTGNKPSGMSTLGPPPRGTGHRASGRATRNLPEI